VYAHRDAVFVTCPRASGWVGFADALANPEKTVAPQPGIDSGVTGKLDDVIDGGTGADEATMDEFKELMRLNDKGVLTAEQKIRLAELGGMIDRAAGRKAVAPIQFPTDRQREGSRRLAFLCRLIREDRRPWCPVNAILLLVPWAATEADDRARLAAETLHRDVEAARAALQLRCNTFALVTDLETAPGYAEFRRGFSDKAARKRFGQGLPVVPDKAPADVPEFLDDVADWLRRSRFPSYVISFLKLDGQPDPRRSVSFVPPANHGLFKFLDEVHARGHRVGTILTNGLAGDLAADPADPLGRLPLCGGYYFAATGRTATEQAFTTEVFEKMLDEKTQRAVAWSPAAHADEAWYRRAAYLGFAVEFAVLAGLAGLVYYKTAGGK
jgi:hypothetical protein